MPNSGSNPSDVQTKLAVNVHQLSPAPAASPDAGRAQPFGQEPPGYSGKAGDARAEIVARLLPAATALLAIAQEALVSGATTAEEIRSMQALEHWVARLVVERAEPEAPPRPTRSATKKR